MACGDLDLPPALPVYEARDQPRAGESTADRSAVGGVRDVDVDRLRHLRRLVRRKARPPRMPRRHPNETAVDADNETVCEQDAEAAKHGVQPLDRADVCDRH